MPVLWQSSQRPMYVRTVWVDGFRHAILSHDDPYLIQLNAKRHRPHSSASYTNNIKSHSRNSRLSHNGDDFEDCLRKLNLVIRSDKSKIIKRQRPRSSQDLHIEKLNLVDFEGSDDDFVVRASPQVLNDSDRSNNDCFNMRNFRANKTARTEVKENTDLSERVLQWLDLAGKVDLLATENAERISQPRHSWPVIQRNHTLSKSKTAIDIRSREGARIYSSKTGDSPKAQQSGTIDRHEFYVPTSANTIENYARQSRNVKITPRAETGGKTRDNPNKTKPRDFRTNVVETRQKVVSERNAVEKQYAELINKKLIPDLTKTPKKQVHIFIPEMPKKPISNATSRTESLLSTNSFKSLKK